LREESVAEWLVDREPEALSVLMLESDVDRVAECVLVALSLSTEESFANLVGRPLELTATSVFVDASAIDRTKT